MQQGRVAILEGIFDDTGFDFVGIQEARVQVAQQRRGRSYVMVSSSADDSGSHGVQLWVHCRHEKLIRATVPASPKLLAVKLDTAPRPTWVFVIHAPSAHSKAPPAEVDAFWAALDALYLDAAAADPTAVCVGLADFNAHLGSVTSGAVGCAGAVKECTNGLRTRMWLEAHTLRAVNTFVGAQPTWTGARGHRSRIDYVFIKQSDAHAVSRVGVVPGIDLSTSERADHDVLAACVDLATLGSSIRAGREDATAWTRPHAVLHTRYGGFRPVRGFPGRRGWLRQVRCRLRHRRAPLGAHWRDPDCCGPALRAADVQAPQALDQT